MTFLKKLKILSATLILSGSLTIAAQVKAQALVTDPGTYAGLGVLVGQVVSLVGLKTEEKVEKMVDSSILSAVKIAAANAFRYFTQKLAYDGAVYLTAGGSGQKPLLATKSFGDYITDTATDAAGVAITEFGDRIGVDFCEPSGGPLLQVAIQFGLSESESEKGPKTTDKKLCTLNAMLDNFDQHFANFESPEQAFKEIGVLFEPGGNDLGFTLKANQQVQALRIKAVEEAIAERFEGMGFLPQKDSVSKIIKTPGSYVAQEAFGLNSSKLQQAQQGEFQSMTAGDSIGYILANSAITFANTLAQRGIERLVAEGFMSVSDLFDSDDESSLYAETANGGFGGISTAQLAYADLLTPQVATGGDFSLLAEFSACPQGSRGTNNCVVDQKFVSAINFAQQGTPLTLKQAVEKNLIDGNWRLLPKNHELNSKFECRTSAFCYSNLVKLRRARILPLGFELAADASPKDNPWTLSQVMNGFNNCNQFGKLDDTHPYCHLIDPNWILKAPPTRCAARGAGQTLLSSNSDARSEYCADVQDCVATDDQGNCVGGWGYCLAEKNVWRLDADTCPAQFAGCTVYASRTGNSQGYLVNTIDSGICDATNIGCRKYLAYQVRKGTDGALTWVAEDELLFVTQNKADKQILLGQDGALDNSSGTTRSSGRARYFNKNVSTCSERDAGCTSVIRADNSTLNVKLAPDSLACYDTNIDTREIELPYSVEDAKKLASQQGCNMYASVCAEEELGCSAFSPENGGADVTGIVKAGDSCATSCVGYNAYKQEKTNFEDVKFPVYAIPANATQCTFDQAGCDEFTNLDTTAGGGEKKEYYKEVRICKKPSEVAPSNFYTWEGTDTVGYQIRGYSLEAATDGSPRYNTDDAAILADYAATCTKDSYNNGTAGLDCREIYNATEQVFYRYLSKTITVAEDCHPLRKTNSTQDDCAQSGGVWQTGNFCLYKAIPAESTSCTPQAAGCRIYQGPAKDIVVSQTFEGVGNLADEYGWAGGTTIATESLVVGGHSMNLFNYGLQTRNTKMKFEGGSTYSVTFWAKGDGVLDVGVNEEKNGAKVKHSFVGSLVTIPEKTLTSTWRQYRFGPITLPQVPSEQVQSGVTVPTFELYIDNDLLSKAFVDNFELTKGEFFTFIKGSSNIPLACDANPSDAIPGAALGCNLYTTQESKKVALRSFTNLCRPEAIGCELVKDTRNTKSPSTIHYNLEVDGTAGSKNTEPKDNIVIGPDRNVRVVVNKDSVCSSAAQGCRAFGVAVTNAGGTSGTTYETKYLIDNPEKYGGMLCQTAAEGCDAFSSKGASVSYFKDPTATGKLCDYRENVPVSTYSGSVISTGWFKSGTQGNVPCYAEYKLTGTTYGIWKTGDVKFSDPINGHYTGTCTAEFDQCFELVDHASVDAKGKATSYFVIDNNKIDRASCKGNVSRQQGCALFEDTRSPSKSFSTAATYAGSEAKFGAPVAASDFSVKKIATLASEYEKVPAFDFRGNQTQCYSEVITALQNSAMVKTRYICDVFDSLPDAKKNFITSIGLCDGTGVNRRPLVTVGNVTVEQIWKDYIGECNKRVVDANVVLKVRRDRECGEWLACNSYIKSDNAPAERQLQCTGLGLCGGISKSKNGSVQCTKWLKPEQATLYGSIMTAANYAKRGVAYNNSELSGLSSGGNFSPAQYGVVELINTTTKKSTYTLAASMSDEYRVNFKYTSSDQDLCLGKVNGSECTMVAGATSLTKNGKCYNGQCSLSVDGKTLDPVAPPTLNGVACRVAPETSAPFGSGVVAEWNGKTGMTPITFAVQEYSRANVCDQNSSCSCSYQKIKYGGTEYYVDIGGDAPRGICNGGFTAEGASKKGFRCGDGEFCSDDRETDDIQTEEDQIALNAPGTSAADRRKILAKGKREHGTCQMRDLEVQQYRGWQGFCMEPDLRTPIYDKTAKYACNSWYPVDAAPGIFDLYNQNKKAGYDVPTASGVFWCTQSSGNMSTATNDSYSQFASGKVCSANSGQPPNTACSKDADCWLTDDHQGRCENRQAYTYNSMTFAVNNPQVGGYGTKIEKNYSELVKTDLRLTQDSVYSNELDGMLVTTSLSTKEMFIGNDNKVRCYSADFESPTMGAAFTNLCKEYGVTVGDNNPIEIKTEVADQWMAMTYKKRNTDKSGVSLSEDWLLMGISWDAFDIGKDCNEDDGGVEEGHAWQRDHNAGKMGRLFTVGDGNPFVDTDGIDDARSGNDAGWLISGGGSATGVGAGVNAMCNSMGEDGSCGGGQYGEDRELRTLRFHFNKDGVFEKATNVSCRSNAAAGTFNASSVKLQFREQCIAIAQAVDEAKDETYAYTQRLWNKQIEYVAEEDKPVTATYGIYDRETNDKQSYGDNSSRAGKISYHIGSLMDNGTENAGRINYGERSAPYGSFPVKKLTPENPYFTYMRALKDPHVDELINGKTKPELADQVVHAPEFVHEAATLGCEGGNCGEYQYNQYKSVYDIAEKSFTRLFAKPLKWFKFENARFVVQSPDSGHDVRKTEGVPPTIAAIDESTTNDAGGYAIKKLGAFNVNGRYGDDSVNFGAGDMSATIRFAAWADTDQMPLTRMYVDWNDGSKSGGAVAKYKNRKTYCSTESEPIGYCQSDTQKPNLTCKTDADCTAVGQGPKCLKDPGFVFGNDPAACSTGLFEYQHVYTYDLTCGSGSVSFDLASPTYPKHITLTKTMLESPDLKILKNLDVKEGDNVCIFKPKVQVQDSWKWCNAGDATIVATNSSCITARNGQKGCLDELQGATAKQKACGADESNPWTSYAGRIIVVEPKE